MSAWARIGSRPTDLSLARPTRRAVLSDESDESDSADRVPPYLPSRGGRTEGGWRERAGRGLESELEGGGTEEGWGWASDLSDSSDLSDRAQPHPMTPGLRRYALYIRPRQGVALTDRQSVRHPGGVAGLLATTGSRVIGAAPLRPVARKRAPTRGVFFIAIKDLCKMVFGRKSTAFSAGTLQNAPDARN